MDSSFFPPIVIEHQLMAQPAAPITEPLQRAGELSLTMPLSANMDLVREIASFALDPAPYSAIFGLSLVAIGLAIGLHGRSPSFADLSKTICDAVLFAGALALVSMISPLPIGYAILLPGLLATVGAAMFLVVLTGGAVDLVVMWVARRVGTKPALHRHHPRLRVCLLFTRQWFRGLVLAVGLGVLFAAFVYRFVPFVPLGIPMVAASLTPRNVWHRLARNALRQETARQSKWRSFIRPINP